MGKKTETSGSDTATPGKKKKKKKDPIPEKDTKILWGRAAGRCSKCQMDLTPELERDLVLIGEMAHVIAREEDGPRGSEDIAEDLRNTYYNLILLCPTDHTLIDKAPKSFSVSEILGWKAQHEAWVKKLGEGTKFASRGELFIEVKKLLNGSKAIWEQYGPTSLTARRNPLSEVVRIWSFRKLSEICPAHRKIINHIESNSELLSVDEHALFIKFKEHALAFEQNSIERLDREAVPVFPVTFEEFVTKEAIRGS